MGQVVLFICLANLLAGCGQAPAVTGLATRPAADCTATTQDAYVYDPHRLQVVQACVRVTGRVDAVRASSDGDTVILLHVDPAYQGLLTPGNETGEEHDDLGVEAVCTLPPVEPLVFALCANDAAPVTGPYPSVGAHVWMEGRYILDLNHDAHAELHPLYRFGVLPT